MAGTRTVAQVGEEGLLRRFRRRFGAPTAEIPIAVGDDAALLRVRQPGLVLTCDTLVEDVDFRFRWARWGQVGRKAAAVNLSDLAAMGARPRALLLSVALRPSDRVRDVMSLVGGVSRVGRAHGAPLVGGDLSETSGPFVITVTAVGEGEPKRLLRRGRGRPGDSILVSGSLGGSAAVLAALEAGLEVPRGLAKRHLEPSPRVALGLALAREGGVRSVADVSDGLARDALHVVQPGCGVRIAETALPVDDATRRLCRRGGWSPLELALVGGEDFELVMAVAPRQRKRVTELAAAVGSPLTEIGHVTSRAGLHVRRGGKWHRISGGFSHFTHR